ncbi:uncharacterized protein [Dermacentor albipictus]|uniref:uncharacterized protein n=1 Tax=Dermacentor albipictus TaxID=60249 RepID=UPI0038FC3A8D
MTHDFKLASGRIEYVMVEILLDVPQRNQRRNSVFVLSVYSNPRDSRQPFQTILKKATDLAGRRPLVVVGDFNAPYDIWGYVYDTTKGRKLWQYANEMDLTLVTDKNFPTRIGNYVTRDSTPDLAFVRNVEDVGCENTAMEFGSDNYILETNFKVSRSRVSEFTFIDWDHFRKIREEPGSARAPATLEEWCEGIRNDASAATKKALCEQQWDELCESIDGQMRNAKSWSMLKHLLDESGSKSNQRHTLARALHEATRSHTVDELVAKLIQKYLPVRRDGDPSTQIPDYRGPPRTELDEDFSIAEVRQAIFALNRKYAPGPDGVTNRLLRNLDDTSIVLLTDKINESWKSGIVPAEWKAACTVLIPKPGKAPNIENLRPIFLTSCVGKVMECALLNRLNGYLEDYDVYTYNMIGFRAGLFHSYVSSFLTERKARLRIGDFRSEDVALGGRGTPQGAVISPTLFNICMIGLSERLARVEDMKHTIYTVDITIWCSGACEGRV